uniref:Uncharacterized protein LOC114329391 n=1 Tax=Diabrotica virgifera virgifera TaxID=50390 RepID=A0A6P7FE44_DIAVI
MLKKKLSFINNQQNQTENCTILMPSMSIRHSISEDMDLQKRERRPTRKICKRLRIQTYIYQDLSGNILGDGSRSSSVFFLFLYKDKTNIILAKQSKIRTGKEPPKKLFKDIIDSTFKLKEEVNDGSRILEQEVHSAITQLTFSKTASSSSSPISATDVGNHHSYFDLRDDCPEQFI